MRNLKIILFTIYYYGDRMKDYEEGGARSGHGGGYERKSLLEELTLRLED
jgi:hypothetical protein